MSLFLVDIGKPVTFIDIPSTGGMSIREGNELSDFHLYDPEDYWPSLSLAVVRDPYDRLESCWQGILESEPDLGFHSFVNYTVNLSPEKILQPDTIDHQAARMTHPLHGLQHANFIINFSNLQSEFDEFCESVNVEPYKLPEYSVASDCPSAPHTPALESLIRQIYAQDYEFLESM